MDIRSARTILGQGFNSNENDYLLSYVLGKDRAWLYAHPEYQLGRAQSIRLRELAEKRKAGQPLAYLKGYHEFYGLNFLVNEAVLIPRPETEIAVARAIDTMPTASHLLDLGCGCGNIAIAVAYHRPDLHIVASDISKTALDVARNNAAQHRCKITWVHSDWYQNINGSFDWIIANPPYVAFGDTDADLNAIAAEPELALYAADNGTADLRSVITAAGEHLYKNGTLLVEHGSKQAETVTQLMQGAGFGRIRCLKDAALHPRYTEARRQ